MSDVRIKSSGERIEVELKQGSSVTSLKMIRSAGLCTFNQKDKSPVTIGMWKDGRLVSEGLISVSAHKVLDNINPELLSSFKQVANKEVYQLV